MAEITNVAKRAEPLGVQVVDVRLRRIEFAPEISGVGLSPHGSRAYPVWPTNCVFDRRGRKREDPREADRQREVIVAQAMRAPRGIMGEGDAQVGSIYAQAFGRNTEFYTYYKSLGLSRGVRQNR